MTRTHTHTRAYRESDRPKDRDRGGEVTRGRSLQGGQRSTTGRSAPRSDPNRKPPRPPPPPGASIRCRIIHPTFAPTSGKQSVNAGLGWATTSQETQRESEIERHSLITASTADLIRSSSTDKARTAEHKQNHRFNHLSLLLFIYNCLSVVNKQFGRPPGTLTWHLQSL